VVQEGLHLTLAPLLLFLALQAAAETAGEAPRGVAAPPAKVEISLEGIQGNLREDLLAALALARHSDSPQLTPAFIRTLYARAEDELRTALKSRGYYNPTVNASLREDNGTWHARFDVQLGPPVRITVLDVRLLGAGADDGRLGKVLEEDFPLRRGARFRHKDYETAKKRIANAALEKGYMENRWVEHRVVIDPEANAAEVTLVFDTGPRYAFGEVELPDTVVTRATLERMMPFRPGEPYDLDKVLRYQQRLRDSDFFREVNVVPQPGLSGSRTVPVRVELRANPRNTWRVGVGYGTDTGPRIAADWDNRYLNRRGHGAEARLRLSPVLSTLAGNYLVPFFRGENVELGLTALLSHEDTDTSESNLMQTGVRRLTSRWGWNETLSLNYRYEDFEVGSVKDTSHLLMPGIGYWKAVADDLIYPRKGWRLSMDLRTAVDGFVSDTTFLQGLLRAKYIFPVADVGRFIARADFGGTLVSDVQDLPATLRFFAGGDNSVRGFDYESLGPKDSNGEVTGGRYLAVGSAEYEHQVKGNWSVAVFSDFGNAFDEFGDAFEYSVGTGVRWRSPVGLVRVDVAAGISDDDLPIRLHLVIGPDL